MKTYLFNDFWGTTGENQVIDTFCISTLHIKLGIVNRISSEIEKRCPVYLPFCNPIGLVKDPYNNKDYSGRYCDKLLRNLDKLEEIVSKDLLPLVEALRAFNKVVHSCFGTDAHDNYKEQINAFEKCSFDIYMDFDVNFSTKAHIPIEHVPQVIQRTGKGSKFDIFWQRFKVIDVESEKHGERLLECVVEFNTKNI